MSLVQEKLELNQFEVNGSDGLRKSFIDLQMAVDDMEINQEYEVEIREVLNEEAIDDVEVPKAYIRKHEARSKRMQGLAYVGYDRQNKIVKHSIERPARLMGKTCESKYCLVSQYRNCSKFSENSRQQLFDGFWQMSWEQKIMYVCNLMIEVPKKRKYTEGESKRKQSVNYYLKLDGTPKQVCRNMFLRTLGVNEKMIRGWRTHSLPNGFQLNPSIVKEKRKKKYSQSDRCKKFEQVQAKLMEFLDLYPKLESHYCRKDTKKVYFQTEFRCKSDLYKQYKDWGVQQSCSVVSLSKFCETLKKNKLALFKPKKDQCDVCTSNKQKNTDNEKYLAHILNKEKASSSKEKDKEEAMAGKCVLLCADVGAVKLCPQIYVCAQYFKMKLQIHNFTIYNMVTHESSNYIWDECNGELVASVFTSIMIHHLEQHLSSATDKKLPIIIYTDGCGYQNRNNVLSNALLNFAIKHGVQVEQKYLEKGHTQMECDSSHALIERKVKGSEINLPSEFVSKVRSARSKPFPLTAHHLSYDFFLNYDDSELLTFSSIRPGQNKKGEATVNTLRALKYQPDGKIFCKTDFDKEYVLLPQTAKTATSSVPKKLYENHVPISHNKYKHLQELKPFLPKDTHSFYDGLPFIPEKNPNNAESVGTKKIKRTEMAPVQRDQAKNTPVNQKSKSVTMNTTGVKGSRQSLPIKKAQTVKKSTISNSNPKIRNLNSRVVKKGANTKQLCDLSVNATKNIENSENESLEDKCENIIEDSSLDSEIIVKGRKTQKAKKIKIPAADKKNVGSATANEPMLKTKRSYNKARKNIISEENVCEKMEEGHGMEAKSTEYGLSLRSKNLKRASVNQGMEETVQKAKAKTKRIVKKSTKK